MAKARCACGEIVLTITGTPSATVMCHCKDCQRRTGSPFGVGNYYTPDQVEIAGSPKTYERGTDSGNRLRNFFLPVLRYDGVLARRPRSRPIGRRHRLLRRPGRCAAEPIRL